MISAEELREQLHAGMEGLSGEEAHEQFSENLEIFLEENGIDEADIISGESDYAPILSEASYNGLDFRGMEGTGLSLTDAHRILNDDEYRLEMAETHLAGEEIDRIAELYPEVGADGVTPSDPVGAELYGEAVSTREFMHYEMRDALNSGPGGAPATFEDFSNSLRRRDWMEMEGDQAAFHQNGGEDDLKFVHPDGRELVYDGDTGQLMTDDRFMGTYNYVNATIPEDATPSPWEAYRNTQTEGSQLHKEYDVDPWIELGNTRADRYANGGEAARQEQMNDAIAEGIRNSFGNSVDETQERASEAAESVAEKASQAGEVIAEKAGEVRDSAEETAGELRDAAAQKIEQAGEVVSDMRETVSEKASQAGAAISNAVGDARDAVSDRIGDLKDFGRGLMPGDRSDAETEAEDDASVGGSTAAVGAGAGATLLPLEDAIRILGEDEKTLRDSNAGGEISPTQTAVNHPDAAEMFHNLQTHEIETIPAEITPDMGPEERIGEILIAGEEATRDAGIPMPNEQREADAAQEIDNSHQQQQQSNEDEYAYEPY